MSVVIGLVSKDEFLKLQFQGYEPEAQDPEAVYKTFGVSVPKGKFFVIVRLEKIEIPHIIECLGTKEANGQQPVGNRRIERSREVDAGPSAGSNQADRGTGPTLKLVGR